MKELFERASRYIKENNDFVYTAIISKNGSSPAGIGARMLVTSEDIVGTIGGGGVEGDVIKLAREMLCNNDEQINMKEQNAITNDFDSKYERKKSFIKEYTLTSNDAAVSEFICGGSCEILIYYVNTMKQSNVDFFLESASAADKGENAWIIYSIDNMGKESKGIKIALSVEGRGVFGEFTGSDKVTRDMVENPIRISIHSDTDSNTRYVVDKLINNNTMLLFGAGHVSRQVAALAVYLEFKVVVIDDREEFLNYERFPGCELVLIESFEKLKNVKTDKNSYILIITRGHLNDKTVLEWALDKPCTYLGMIGSRIKRDKLYEQLLSNGADESKIKSVHCPIGLAIGAKTPAEIAVSIMAEIIMTKNSINNQN